MPSFFDELRNRFHELHTDLISSIKDLPDEAMDWVPGRDMNSISVLVTHLTGSERYLIGVALDEPPERDRQAEFKVKGLPSAKLVARLTETDEYVLKALVRLSGQDLTREHLSPRSQKQVTAGWCILHSLDHSAIHTGQLQITRQLWEQKKG
jgi:uncharacterized damage-inducible protein DinB